MEQPHTIFYKDDIKNLDSSLISDDVSALRTRPTTQFRQSVWDAISKIPYNETRTYSDIAKSVGKPHAVRAVASACGANDIAILIPCHRVVPKNQKNKGDYRWGSGIKQKILNSEK